jgi:hypothetical protein
VLPAGPVRGDTAAEIIENVDADGFAVIGTPDDAIAKIGSLVEQSGGFGTFLFFGHEWANREATKHSFELFAQYVMPHFQDQLATPAASCDWVTGSGQPGRDVDHEGDPGPCRRESVEADVGELILPVTRSRPMRGAPPSATGLRCARTR